MSTLLLLTITLRFCIYNVVPICFSPLAASQAWPTTYLWELGVCIPSAPLSPSMPSSFVCHARTNLGRCPENMPPRTRLLPCVDSIDHQLVCLFMMPSTQPDHLINTYRLYWSSWPGTYYRWGVGGWKKSASKRIQAFRLVTNLNIFLWDFIR